MASLTEENYLKAMFHLSDKTGEVSVNSLSKHLSIKMPTVTSMVKKLAEKKFVHYQSYKPLKLTEKGKKEAALIIRKHRLTEMFLVEKMDFGWDEVHEVAEQMEHIKAPRLFEKMDVLLGHPKIDPHGSPIPDKHGKIDSSLNYTKLSECKAGDTVSICAVMHSTNDFLKFLNSRKIKLGLAMQVKEVEPFDGSMTVCFGKKTEVLSNKVCEKLLVQKNTRL